jgi:hypothetical protein
MTRYPLVLYVAFNRVKYVYVNREVVPKSVRCIEKLEYKWYSALDSIKASIYWSTVDQIRFLQQSGEEQDLSELMLVDRRADNENCLSQKLDKPKRRYTKRTSSLISNTHAFLHPLGTQVC